MIDVEMTYSQPGYGSNTHLFQYNMYVVNKFKEIIRKIEISGNRTAIICNHLAIFCWQCADANVFGADAKDHDYNIITRYNVTTS